MSFSINKMAIEDFVSFEQLLGPRITRLKDTYWRQVRPCFFRPLVQFQEYRPNSILAPRAALFGGVQYAVPPDEPANSFLNCLFFENKKDYSVASLDYERRRQVKQAAKQFVIRPMADVDEFKTKAYLVYLSFYNRTHYEFGSKRREQAYFSSWADALFQIPNVLILGGYRNGELAGVSLSVLIEDTLMYVTFFCTTEAMRLFLSGLMLHAVRATAAACPDVRQVFASMYKGGEGLDDFYLGRGAKIVRKRAMLQLSPLSKVFLKYSSPKTYAKLLGTLDDQEINLAIEQTRPC